MDTDASSSENDTSKQYIVEKILAERGTGRNRTWLVQWQGYHIVRSSWEPRASFDDTAPLEDWHARKKLEQSGREVSFDVEGLERAQKQRQQKIAARKRKRASLPRTRLKVDDSEPEDTRISPYVSPRTKSRKRRKLIVDDTDEDEESNGDCSPAPRKLDLGSLPTKSSRTPEARPTRQTGISRSEIAQSPSESTKQAISMVTKPLLESSNAVPSDETAAKASKSTIPAPPQPTVTKSPIPAPSQPTVTHSAIPAPSQSTIKKTKVVDKTFSKWDASKGKRGPARREIAREGAEDKFVSTAQRGRFNKTRDRDPTDRLDSLFIGFSIEDDEQRIDTPTAAHSSPSVASGVNARVNMGTSNSGSEVANLRPTTSAPETMKKVKMTCYKWLTPGFDCKEPSRCPFYHEEGFKVSDPTGFVPPKYYLQPLTCWYWLRTKCRLDEEDCNYAHYDTGLVAPLPNSRGKPVSTEKSEPIKRQMQITTAIPSETAGPENFNHRSDQAELRGLAPPQDAGYNPWEMTCYSWWYDYCTSGIHNCSYAHRALGIIAPAEDITSGPTNIGISTPPPGNFTHGKVWTLTCPYWLKGKCKKSVDECTFMHYSTGWVKYRKGPRQVLLDAGPAPEFSSLVTHRVCDFWLVGKCRYGNKCYHRHENNEPVNPLTAGRTKDVKLPPAELLTQDLTGNAGPQLPGLPEQALQDSVNVKIILKDRDTTVNLDTQLLGLDAAARGIFIRLAGTNPIFEDTGRIESQMFYAFVYGGPATIKAQGRLVSEPASSAAFTALADSLRHYRHYLAAFHSEFTLIIEPLPEGETSLGFQILDAIQVRISNHSGLKSFSTDASKSGALQLCEAYYGLDLERIFHVPGQDSAERKKLKRSVFLMADPSHHQTEFSLWKRAFQSAGVDVYDPTIDGHWEHFNHELEQKTNVRAVLFHSDIDEYHDISNLRDVLMSTCNLFRFDPIVLQDRQAEALTYRKPWSNLFPNGAIFCITDDVFEYDLAGAAQVLDLFDKNFRGKKLTTKIAGRPGLRQWLYELADKYDARKDAKDLKRIGRCLEVVTHCMPFDQRDTYDFEVPSEDAQAVFLSQQDLPRYAGMWTNEETRGEATDLLVQWFAGWSCQPAQVDKFRRFFVVHPDKRRQREWEGLYHHVKIITPSEAESFIAPKRRA